MRLIELITPQEFYEAFGFDETQEQVNARLDRMKPLIDVVHEYLKITCRESLPYIRAEQLAAVACVLSAVDTALEKKEIKI